MNRKTRKWLCIAAVLVLLTGLGGAAGWFFTTHVIVEGAVYPRSLSRLDLRGTEVSPESWEALHTQLPECEILWDAPFQGSRYSSDTRELAVTALAEADIAELDYFPELERVDGTGCTDYAALTALLDSRPDLRVDYTVTIDGRDYPRDAQTLTLTDISDQELALLQWLPALKAVDACGITDLSRIDALQQALPECEISYQVDICGEAYPHTAEALSLTGADPAELAALLPYLPQVTAVDIYDPVPNGQALQALADQFPHIRFSWETYLYGLTVTQETTEVDLTDIPLESLEGLKAVLSCYPNVEQLVLCGCGLDNETLAAFREEMRQEYKVVWSVVLGPATMRTDIIYFSPVKDGLPHLLDDQVYNLRYCEDLMCIDLGHHEVTHCDWAAFMPHLKYLVLADAPVTDISGLEGRTELLFLELFITHVTDLTPLESCTALEDLNLSYAWFADPTPVSRMPWLKRLWWAECPWSEGTFRQYLPDTEFSFARMSSTGGTWRQGQNYYDMRDMIGMYYMTG